MPRTLASNTILRQLQIVFLLSFIVLLVSIVASFISTQKLISNSKLVNHTNEVLIEAENVISFLKDAETGQRGFLITKDEAFLQVYTEAFPKVTASFDHLSNLTIDNPAQQKNMVELKSIYSSKFVQMQKVIDLTRKTGNRLDTLTRHDEMLRGKVIMDKARVIVDLIKSEENKILEVRLGEQSRYITFTPILLVFAALVSLLITGFAYIRIKKDLEYRIKEQKLAEEKYLETNQRIAYIESTTQQVENGDYSVRSLDNKDDELGRISKALNKMTSSLESTFNDMQDQAWLQDGKIQLGNAIRGERVVSRLAENLIDAIASYIQAPVAAIYIVDQDWNFKLSGSYAITNAPSEIRVGDGLVGQAIKDKTMAVITDLPSDYHKVASSLGSAASASAVLLPIVYNDDCLGIIELGMLRRPSELELEFLRSNQEAIATGVNAALDFIKLQNFLEETQAQSEELQAQHNELENLNAELEAQSQKLQSSEEELRVQQEELQQTNRELEERSAMLEDRNSEILQKAQELEQSTRYKSEFLANMSHELRTPLNSILLLSRLLSENNENNLTAEQIEFAKVIRSSGNGLLGLIDEILDLSKIEAGKMELEKEDVEISGIAEGLISIFGPMAKEKNLDFQVVLSPAVPAIIKTDKMRLEQIVKNLVSNALKFTSSGSVTVSIEAAEANPGKIRFGVKDTGIGIAPDKQQLIFEAFQQADGSTKRKYGGTGLGLSISRELAKFLGGEISLKSKEGEGSEFSLYLPVDSAAPVTLSELASPIFLPGEQEELKGEVNNGFSDRYVSPVIPDAIPDDRNDLNENDKVILIVEDDTFFAKSLLDYTRRKGYKGVVTVRGDEALQLAIDVKPKGILLDIQLPVLSGWEVMDQLKVNAKTRHIPVHIMSSHKLRNESLLKGAVDFIDKPVALDKFQEIFQKIEYVLSKKSKKVLILEDNPMHAKALAYFLGTFQINSELKSDVSEGIAALKGKNADCVILDMGIPDKNAYDTLEEVKRNPEFENLPIIIFTGKSLSMTEELKIKKYADSIIVKTAHSYQRMLDEVSLFLHLVEENRPSEKNSKSKNLGGLNEILNNKTVLIADDDVRNIFSLSKALENYKINVITALDGKEALARLEENPEIDVVLLDMMMPQMDGYETAKRIRENSQWENLPVIAVTAKAMTGDREKCINAGASDYITKPVDIDQLMSLLRVWLYEKS